MILVKRKKGESFESLYRRFGRRVQQSGSVLESKKNRFHKPELSKSKQRASALRRLSSRVKREYLLRTGQLIEERFPQKR
ncbi:30S ribosomal protein S21 [Candidatus Uhrbacteria bacterium]|nr:30S ribosomal protein S21 [Candidatus Uhrbacteria bacterium]